MVLTATNGTQLRVLLMEQRIQPMLRAISLHRRVTIAPSPAVHAERSTLQPPPSRFMEI